VFRVPLVANFRWPLGQLVQVYLQLDVNFLANHQLNFMVVMI
jgi:hypothetical protein